MSETCQEIVIGDADRERCGCALPCPLHGGKPLMKDAVNALELSMVKLGFDFETHATKKVKYLGGGFGAGLVPVGATGVIIYTWEGELAQVQVRWSSGDEYGHAWTELEVIP